MAKVTKTLIYNLVLGINFVLIFTLMEVAVSKNVSLAIATNQSIPAEIEDYRIYQTIIKRIQIKYRQQTIDKTIQQVSEQLLGAKYEAGLLDRSPQESLFVSLRQFDCMLFIETVLAIAHNIHQQNYSYQSLSHRVENQRYWNGKMNGYCSRLHYFSDWIEDNQRRGNVRNITPRLKGVNTVKKLNFMTTHRSSYPNLVKSDLNFKCISRVEASLSQNFNYIPTKNIKRIYPQLKAGDIVGIATDIPGLDFTHTGFVYQLPNGNLGLIHASPVGKVVIAKDLQNYVENVKNAIGIVVTRAHEPKLR